MMVVGFRFLSSNHSSFLALQWTGLARHAPRLITDWQRPVHTGAIAENSYAVAAYHCFIGFVVGTLLLEP
eukprot:9914670-Lingulodinium_polyedra.AAC.1